MMIKEAAYAVGYDDQFYFNKLFDVNSLSEAEILGNITSSEIANQLYKEASKKYDEAFEQWEVDPATIFSSLFCCSFKFAICVF